MRTELIVRNQSTWTKLVLFVPEQQEWDETACSHFPKTCQLLRKIPELHIVSTVSTRAGMALWGGEMVAEGVSQHRVVPGELGIFRMGPESALVPHTGSTNLRLTAHLPLVVPGESRLEVGRESVGWKEGEVVIFDDSFIHSAENFHPTEDRWVLLLNFFKPGVCRLPDHSCTTHLKWKN